MTSRKRPVIDRLMEKVVEDENGCWIFTGARSSSGYGSIGLGSRDEGTGSTHVVVYQFFVGEIPVGLELDHLCRTRSCCNFLHLDPVPRRVNAERGERHSSTHCDNGHERTAENTMLRANGRIECRPCYRLAMRTRRALNKEKASS